MKLVVKQFGDRWATATGPGMSAEYQLSNFVLENNIKKEQIVSIGCHLDRQERRIFTLYYEEC